jgi:adenylate cyclase
MEHRFAVILSADVVGYSRLMGADEEGTLTSLKAIRRDLIDPTINEHKGRIVRTMGDGLLAEFNSVVDAVRCAIGIQCRIPQLETETPEDHKIRFRMAINMGDVIADGQSIFGDGIAVASRMESLAKPGGINVSRAIRDQVRDRLPISFEDLGEYKVDNVVRPVRIFSIRLNDVIVPETRPAPKRSAAPGKPRIVVLPFQNLGGDQETEFFLDSLAEDLITELARARWFSVVARNTSFNYKGEINDPKELARDLGVRYVIEGSLRKSGSRIRIACQLVEAASGGHLWAERFDGTLEDTFDLQDTVIETVIGSVVPALRIAEIERARRKPEEGQRDTYDLILRALPPAFAETAEDNAQAIRLLAQAMEVDPANPDANALAAWCRQQRHLMDWPAGDEHDREIAKRMARAAIAAGSDNPLALALAGTVRAMLTHDHPLALAAIDRAVMLNINSAIVLGFAALTRCICGAVDRAIEDAERAIRLSPSEPLLYPAIFALALGCLRAGRNQEASLHARRAIEANRNFALSYCVLAMSLTRCAQADEAAQAVGQLISVAPRFRLRTLRRIRFADPAILPADLEILRAAGVPD